MIRVQITAFLWMQGGGIKINMFPLQEYPLTKNVNTTYSNWALVWSSSFSSSSGTGPTISASSSVDTPGKGSPVLPVDKTPDYITTCWKVNGYFSPQFNHRLKVRSLKFHFVLQNTLHYRYKCALCDTTLNYSSNKGVFTLLPFIILIVSSWNGFSTQLWRQGKK